MPQQQNTLLQRTAPATLRSVAEVETDSRGEFEATVSVFGNTDSYGDVVEHGAFTATLAEWTIKGSLPPVVWAHQFHEPENFLGQHLNFEQTETALVVRGRLDLNRRKASEVYELMRDGSISEFSWSGLLRKSAPLDDDLDPDSLMALFGPQKIQDVDLWEAGPCFKGANPATELVSVKTDPRLERILRTPELAAQAASVLTDNQLSSIRKAHAALEELIHYTEAPEPESTEEREAPGLESPDNESEPEPEQPAEPEQETLARTLQSVILNSL